MQTNCLAGPRAFSPFRELALLERLRAASPALGVGSLSARYLYFLDVEPAFSAGDLARVGDLLGTHALFHPGSGFMVTPRQGTVSSWSSKATDIVHNCGLRSIHRVERGLYFEISTHAGSMLTPAQLAPVIFLLHDRMTQGIRVDTAGLFDHLAPRPIRTVDVMQGGVAALREANAEMGLALSQDEIEYLARAYEAMVRNPTDVELVMFGQVNSEHCRHKIFNAAWRIDGKEETRSLFDMIRHTHASHPEGTLVAYRDNASVIEGFADAIFEAGRGGEYGYASDQVDLVLKVETHNHPTAIAPFPGAATGVGGEIRDEGATGIGARSKAGLSAFMVSSLRIPGWRMAWEQSDADAPTRLASPLEIMIDGPLGGAAFGNEFGRPQLLGMFRTLEQTHAGRARGYHKPIMAAGGMGVIKRGQTQKAKLTAGVLIVQLGGPALRIGLGGGAASSMTTGSNSESLDFDSVQRDNAEMERRCQDVINACIALNSDNPILSIHDIGAGGLSNGCPELVSDTGGEFWLREVPSEDTSLSPMEIWCCEAQERYVLAVAPDSVDTFRTLCARERCPMAVIGRATGDNRLTLTDTHFGDKPIDMDLGVLLGKPPRLVRDVKRFSPSLNPLDLSGVEVREAVERVLRFPAVANKTFLITIADRTVTGCVARDQMIGPYQVPIADAAVTINGYRTFHGQAMAIGERSPVALISGPTSGRLAVGEALTNLAGVDIGAIGKVKLSGNWMCACGEEGEDAALFDTVRAVAMEFCPRLGLSIPVGKDSLSMRTQWQSATGAPRSMTSPLSLLISAFAPVRDVRHTVTPDLKPGESVLMLVDLGGRRNRLGGSVLAQVYGQIGAEAPDVDDPDALRRFFTAMQQLVEQHLIMAYHDRSDGGLFVTVAEMSFGGRRGVRINLDTVGDDSLAALFSEELGGVLQVSVANQSAVLAILKAEGLADAVRLIGPCTQDARLEFTHHGVLVFDERLLQLQQQWSELTNRMQSLRDNPACAQEEFENLQDEGDPGLNMRVTFESEVPELTVTERPRVAILREQGVNGQVEMAAAFVQAGFTSVDVHMTDLLQGRQKLTGFAGLVACGGFSYGDVLGAGTGWASTILFHAGLRAMFKEFFGDARTFALGICNGCQMMAQLKGIIPGAADWPRFVRNASEQFEARLATVEVLPSPSIFFKGMAGSKLLVPVAHGEGRAEFDSDNAAAAVWRDGLTAVRFVDNRGQPTERYPYNPNGTKGGLTALTTPDGRVTIMMPHPERAFRACQLSYRPAGLFEGEAGPWLRIFQNAHSFARLKAPLPIS